MYNGLGCLNRPRNSNFDFISPLFRFAVKVEKNESHSGGLWSERICVKLMYCVERIRDVTPTTLLAYYPRTKLLVEIGA